MQNTEAVAECVKKQFNLPIEFLSQDAITNAYYNYEKCESMANWILSKVDIKPNIAIICGSGLGAIANLVEKNQLFPILIFLSFLDLQVFRIF